MGRRAGFQCAVLLALVVVALSSCVDVISIRRPLVFANDDLLLITYAGLLGVAAMLLVTTATPWRHFGDRKFGAELHGFWWEDHRWQSGALLALFLVTFAVNVMFGAGKGIGGNYSYLQIGRHFFETGGDCGHCPRWAISRSTYVTKVRADGIVQSCFFQWFGLFEIYFAGPLRRFADGDIPGWLR